MPDDCISSLEKQFKSHRTQYLNRNWLSPGQENYLSRHLPSAIQKLGETRESASLVLFRLVAVSFLFLPSVPASSPPALRPAPRVYGHLTGHFSDPPSKSLAISQIQKSRPK